MYINRVLDIEKLLSERSLFLLGPRQSGKSSYIREQLHPSPALIYNLLDRRLLLRLLADPTLLRQEVEARDLKNCVICIDEIQKCPELLDEVHLLIEERHIRFLLTGSSARKLKKAGTNLLGGRGRMRIMHPFSYIELKDKGFSLEKAMYRGMLPPHFLSLDPDEDLDAYTNLYLAEEIAAEGLTRNLPKFARFLQTIATVNSQIINYTNIGNDIQLPRQTVKLWFQVLKDTLLGFDLEPYTKTVKRKAIETAKFYFFDMGVVRSLRRLKTISSGSADYGEFFEHFICMELKTWIDYIKPRTLFNYWRSTSGFEVDFLLEGEIAIEVKSASVISAKHLKGLKALREEGFIKRSIVVCQESRPRLIDGIEILPWEYFLDLLWSNRIL
ncbi:MAG: AAA family ATPase [Spirochaetia bacterium]|jgi:predicted AAA+ superfamily ATPase|nr:AAA family ATPase [Spirochaetia bacterium]